MLDDLKAEDFEALRGGSLPLAAADSHTAVELVEVKRLNSPSPRQHPSFSLLFRAPSTFRGPQGLYRLTHPTLGDIDLFMVPVAAEAGGLLFEVVFN